MNNEFWNEETVKEFLKEILYPSVQSHILNELEKFKRQKEASVLPVKDFEIVTCDGGYNIGIHAYNAGTCLGVNKNVIPCKIHSVRRISDDCLFTVGDNTNQGIITGFFVGWAGMEVHFGNDGCPLNQVKKAKQPVPLFTTNDGVEIFEGGECYYTYTSGNNSWMVYVEKNVKKSFVNSQIDFYFSTEEAVQNFILMNKPCLSMRDVLNICDNPAYDFLRLHAGRLKEITKQKQNL